MFNLLFKEFSLLKRDITGIIILFIMPSVLLIVITCIQNINYNNTSLTPVKILLINNDSEEISNENFLNKKNTGGIIFIDKLNNKNLDKEKATQLIAKGKFKAMLYIPSGMADYISSSYRRLFKDDVYIPPTKKMELIFSKSINPILAKSIHDALDDASIKTQMYFLKLNIFKELDKKPPDKSLSAHSWIQTSYYSRSGSYIRPNTIQQNVPAWALFGMFFIVVPLSATFIHERNSSVMLRLKTTSMKPFNFIISKITAYVIINMIQLSFMALIGIYILPLLNIPELNLEGNITNFYIIGLFSSLAATSFGLFIGSICKTQHQASMLGPVLIVIAAAIGGIMVPTFLMPPALQSFCNFSPLYWGHNAFLDILVRGFNIEQISLNLIKLLFFSICCFIFSWIIFKRQK